MKRTGTIHLISLGCAKNLVDSERLALQLKQGGWRVSFDEAPPKTDIAIVNTCGFIADAKEESIETILNLVEAKKRGELKQVYVFGCLSQRYLTELPGEIPEVDGYFGVDDQQKLLDALSTPFCPAFRNQRHLSTPSHYAYLKVSEGCNRTCAFCIIPSIRGKHRSVPAEDLLEEASYLAGQGVKELLLVAQDLSSYGVDLKQPRALEHLLRELEKIQGIEWIRLHYAYPAGFPLEILPVMAGSPKILPYLDIPFQHASNHILKAMRRGHTHEQSLELIKKFREAVPGIALRTTLITGFPGETEDDFEALMNFVKEVRFDRLGVFTYSEEDGTPAALLTDDIPETVKQERADLIMELQEQISLENNELLVGTYQPVIIDHLEGSTAIGRTRFDSPEVDQEMFIADGEALTPGTIVSVLIEEAAPHDLYGRLA
jgi:ribosomal protein S12 methylthiotransferase